MGEGGGYMSVNFKTISGDYKGLVVAVQTYRPLQVSYCFWNTDAERLRFLEQRRTLYRENPDAIYCFNKEKPMKEQAASAKGSQFGDVLASIIKDELVNKKW